jgi:hypothetical protein
VEELKKIMTITTQEPKDEFGRKMYLVFCLQRGFLEEALKTAQKIQSSEPGNSTINELIRFVNSISNITHPSRFKCHFFSSFDIPKSSPIPADLQ